MISLLLQEATKIPGKVSPRITNTIPVKVKINTSQTLLETIFVLDTLGLICFVDVLLKNPDITRPEATTEIIPLTPKNSPAK